MGYSFTNRRKAAFFMLLAGLSASLTVAHAEEKYPKKPVKIIAPFPVGSGPDANARELSAELTKIFGQTFYVENRPGASNIIGTDAAAKAAPDGYTLYIGATSALSTLPHVHSKLPFNVEKAFTPISLLGILETGLIAHPNVPVNNALELIEKLKEKPESFTVATQGIGGYSHLAASWFNNAAQVKAALIPYNTSSPYNDLLAGQIQLMFDGLPVAASSVKAKKLKLLAITGEERHPVFPDAPTFKELGLPHYSPIAWQGLLAPSGTPKFIIEKLSHAMGKVCESKELAKKWLDYGGRLQCNTPNEFREFIDKDRNMWGQAIRQTGIKLD